MQNVIIREDVEKIWEHVNIRELSGKTVLLTGGTGLIGSYFLLTIKKLNDISSEKTRVILVVHSVLPAWLEELKQEDWLTVMNGDLTDYEFLNCFPKADCILHAAGYGQPGRFLQDRLKTIRLNTLATDVLLSKLLPGGKFLFFSTSEIYSGSEHYPYSEEEYGCTTPQHDRSCYIEGKRCGEAICMAYRQQGVDVHIGRISLAYGPFFRRGDKRVLNNFIEKSVQGNIEMLDSGASQRVYCYASDAVEMLWNILFHGKEAVYNIGGEGEISIRGLAESIAEITGVSVIIPDTSEGLSGAPKATAMNISRYKKEFHKENFVSLKDGLKRTIKWYYDTYEGE